MSRAACPNLVLVEARRDGRLTPSDEASLERHLRTCAACTAHAADLARIGDALREGDDAVSPLAHRRARANLLRAAAAPAPASAPKPRSRGIWVWAPAAAVVAAAAVAALTVLPSSRDEVRDTSSPVASVRMRTVVTPEPGARFERQDAGDLDRVELHEGAIRAEVRKLGPGERFVVRTRDAEVEVRGTIFRVEAANGALRSVDVTEGAVEVRVGDAKWRVEAGDRWQPAVRDEEAAKLRLDPSSAPSASSAPLVVAPSTSAVSPSGSSTPRASSSDGASSIGGPRPTAPAASSSAARPAASSRSLQEGIAAIERGDYGQASKTLEKAGATDSDPERVEMARYLQAVALQRAGRPDEARRAASDYLAKHPDGRFVSEARRIVETP